MIVKMVQMRKIASILAKKRINFNVFMKIINLYLWSVFQKLNIVTERKIVLMVRMKKIVQNQKTWNVLKTNLDQTDAGMQSGVSI